MYNVVDKFGKLIIRMVILRIALKIRDKNPGSKIVPLWGAKEKVE